MNALCQISALLILFCVSCEKAGERMKVEETRGVTTKDREPKLFATSDERFRDAKPGPVRGTPPENWLALPPAQFRDLNYRFGDSGTGEVYVSVISGSIGENVNRWRRQFGQDALSPANIEELERVPMAGGEGVWVTLEGEYTSGMGTTGAKPGYGLAGAVVRVGGETVTVKMIGPKEEVEAERAELKAFAASLSLVE